MFDELKLIAEFKNSLPVYFNFIKGVESFTRYNSSTINADGLYVFIQLIDTRKYNIQDTMISEICLVVVTKNDKNGDYAVIKSAKTIVDNINKLHSNNVRSILVNNVSTPSFEKDNSTWFRVINLSVLWK